MKVVLDSNVLLAASLSDGLCRQVFRHCITKETLIASHHILDEYAEKLERKFGINLDTEPFWQRFKERAKIVSPDPLAKPVCRDRDDDWILATARSAAANIIVTGDNDLLVLKSFETIPIVTPRGFLELIARK